jgi:ASC-1-like (ASCH) protein
MMPQHLIVLKPMYVEAILSGNKTMECRLARRAIVPFHRVEVGDILWLKVSLGPVLARTTVREVFYYDGLTPGKIKELRERFDSEICGTEKYWADRADCRYATLIRLGSIQRIVPFIPGFTMAGPWLVLRGRKEAVFSGIEIN